MTNLLRTSILSCFVFFLSFNSSNFQYTLIIFEGSDWCASCKKFEKEILADSSVIEYLKENSIEIKRVDFPQRKKVSKELEKINKQYAEKYGFQGLFPTIVFSSSNSEDYHSLTSPPVYPEEFLKWLKSKIQQEK